VEDWGKAIIEGEEVSADLKKICKGRKVEHYKKHKKNRVKLEQQKKIRMKACGIVGERKNVK